AYASIQGAVVFGTQELLIPSAASQARTSNTRASAAGIEPDGGTVATGTSNRTQSRTVSRCSMRFSLGRSCLLLAYGVNSPPPVCGAGAGVFDAGWLPTEPGPNSVLPAGAGLAGAGPVGLGGGFGASRRRTRRGAGGRGVGWLAT